MVTDIAATLKERGSRYGKFTDHARYTQSLKSIAQGSPNWDKMQDDQREGLEMILHKIGRILSGDPNYADNWHDIVGYAKLVDDRLQSAEEEIKQQHSDPILFNAICADPSCVLCRRLPLSEVSGGNINGQ